MGITGPIARCYAAMFNQQRTALFGFGEPIDWEGTHNGCLRCGYGSVLCVFRRRTTVQHSAPFCQTSVALAHRNIVKNNTVDFVSDCVYVLRKKKQLHFAPVCFFFTFFFGWAASHSMWFPHLAHCAFPNYVWHWQPVGTISIIDLRNIMQMKWKYWLSRFRLFCLVGGRALLAGPNEPDRRMKREKNEIVCLIYLPFKLKIIHWWSHATERGLAVT